jgi:hypothetical protein
LQNEKNIINSTEQHSAYAHIAARRNRPWKGEEEVRVAWVSALEAALAVHFDTERSNKDGSYNNVIIEFKAPGLFKGSKSSAKFKEAIDKRLLPYIQREAKNQVSPPPITSALRLTAITSVLPKCATALFTPSTLSHSPNMPLAW